MGSSFIIIYSVIVVVFVVLIFILGLFTHISPSLLLIMMFVFLLFNFIVAAGYAANAAAKTGGKDADEANKSAHWYYVWGAGLSWVIVGIAVLAIIGGIVIAILGAPEEAAVGAVGAGTLEAGALGAGALEAGALGAEGAELSSVLGAISETSEGAEFAKLATKIAKEKKDNKNLFDMGHGFSKLIHVVMYIFLVSAMILALIVGILMAIGASIQGGSSSKAGLKKAAISATINLFIAGMYIILFIVMWVKNRNLHKRLAEDLAKQEQLAMEYEQQMKTNIAQAKGQYARQLISHHFGFNQPTPPPVTTR